jgi:hypothetical protein
MCYQTHLLIATKTEKFMTPIKIFLQQLQDDFEIKTPTEMYEKFKSSGLSTETDLKEFNEMYSCAKTPHKNFMEVVLSFADDDQKDTLLKDYCEQLFPKHYNQARDPGLRYAKQKSSLELNESQILEIGKSKIHYYIFLILLLKETKIKRTALIKQFGGADSINSCIDDLIRLQILIDHRGYIYSASSNIIMPKASTDKIKKIYLSLDEWDKSFGQSFNFEKLIEKNIIRKISSKHLPIIQKHLESITELTRSSVTDSNDTSSIIYLQFSLMKGKL